MLAGENREAHGEIRRTGSPAGNEGFGPAASLAGRDLGSDFEPRDGWRMKCDPAWTHAHDTTSESSADARLRTTHLQ